VEWYYSENDRQIGPVSEKKFRLLVSDGKIGPTTLVWHTDLSDWIEFSHIAHNLFPLGSVELDTARGLALPLPGNLIYGGFWIRVKATALDSMLIFAASTAIEILLFMPSKSNFTDPMAFEDSFGIISTSYYFILLLNLLIPSIYEGLMVGKFGATLGKMALGLKVVTPDGGKIR
jgi:uncharacterized protein DUF4339/RDD family protein